MAALMTSLSGMFLLNFLKACGKTKQAKFEGADDTVCPNHLLKAYSAA